MASSPNDDSVISSVSFGLLSDSGTVSTAQAAVNRSKLQDLINKAVLYKKQAYVAAGTYTINGPLDLSGVSFTMDKAATIKAHSTWKTTAGFNEEVAMLRCPTSVTLGYIELDCNFVASGVKMGTPGGPSYCYADTIKAYNVGNNFAVPTDEASIGSIPSYGLRFSGFDCKVNHVETVFGQSGILFKSASDVYLGTCITVNPTNGIYCDGSEHVFINNADIDSATTVGLKIASGNQISFRGSIWFNHEAYTNNVTTNAHAIDITGIGHDITATINSACTGTGHAAFFARSLTNSTANLVIGNPNFFTLSELAMTTALDVNGTVDATNTFNVVFSTTDITTPLVLNSANLLPTINPQRHYHYDAFQQANATSTFNSHILIPRRGRLLRHTGKVTENTFTTGNTAFAVQVNDSTIDTANVAFGVTGTILLSYQLNSAVVAGDSVRTVVTTQTDATRVITYVGDVVVWEHGP